MKKLSVALLIGAVALFLVACGGAPAPTSPVAPTVVATVASTVPPATIATATPPPTVKPTAKAAGPAAATPTGPRCEVHLVDSKEAFLGSLVLNYGPGPVMEGQDLLIPTSSGRLKAVYSGGIYTAEMEGRPETRVSVTTTGKLGAIVTFTGPTCTITNLVVTILYKTTEGEWWIRY